MAESELGTGVPLSLVDEGGACGSGVGGEADALSIAGAWVTDGDGVGDLVAGDGSGGVVLSTVTSAWVVTVVVAVEVPSVPMLGSEVVVVAVAVLLSVPAGVFALIAAVMVMVQRRQRGLRECP